MRTIKILEKIAYSVHIHKVFDDFLNMTVAAFSMQRDEKRYLERAKKYKPEDIKLFGDALGALLLDYQDKAVKDGSWDDVIGLIFEEMELSNAKTGQFFTPKSVCDLMAQITKDGATEGTVNDPSSGSGRNLIAHSRLSQKNRFSFTYIAQDLDERCCLMSVINMIMYGMKGYVIHCNTITMEIFGGWRIYLPETGLGVYPMTKEQCYSLLFETKKQEIEQPETIKTIENEQLKLF